MHEIVALIDRVLQHPQDPTMLDEVRAQAKTLCNRFPIFHAYYSSPGAGSPPVKCPFCDDVEDKVVDSRMAKEGEVIRRRRECLSLQTPLYHVRTCRRNLPVVVKKDGRREPFDRSENSLRSQKSL